MLRLECDPPKTKHCDCCGGLTTTLTRWVYLDGNAAAVYFASFSDNHPDRLVKMVVSLGKWGDGATPADRQAFSLALRAGATSYEVMVTDAAECPWRHEGMLGRCMDRAEALGHPWLSEVFHITDHAVVEDLALKAYLDAA